ncbi:hypothetical protein KIN20_001272 [Parelaphostrongylus tenuis]|uniref:Uncharacterized protein n=1 Tax=Parelaphostrongylus tenuis TaxID=148309 RepID=A0AAD5QCJ3_PARTN|nr:hypothetical protein KIN20_001272 [Parelaphostrongylus tenuis]
MTAVGAPMDAPGGGGRSTMTAIGAPMDAGAYQWIYLRVQFDCTEMLCNVQLEFERNVKE